MKEIEEYDLVKMADELDRQGLCLDADILDDILRIHKESEEYRIMKKNW